jgi:U3 small nucleolar RNA-associated protein 23
LKDVVTKGENGMNKHRLIVASQDEKVRAHMRQIPGVPLVYINRSVMIMEPMAEATEDLQTREERQKIRSGLKTRSTLGKRKREGNEAEALDTADGEDGSKFALNSDSLLAATDNTRSEMKKKRKGPKGPNPLSVKKPKKRIPPAPQPNNLVKDNKDDSISTGKRKRKRKPSSRQEPPEPAVFDG